MSKIEIYTDGACKKDKVGGWGYLIKMGEHIREEFGGEVDTTNNRMEIIAAYRAVKALNLDVIRQRPDTEIVVYSDSSYVVKSITQWLQGWKAKNWIKAGKGKQPVSNKDLWVAFDNLLATFEGINIQWQHVKGHSGNEGNERADTLANLGVEKIRG